MAPGASCITMLSPNTVRSKVVLKTRTSSIVLHQGVAPGGGWVCESFRLAGHPAPIHWISFRSRSKTFPVRYSDDIQQISTVFGIVDSK
jgi:hypothetical protein